jgi:hypothetical protein
MVVLEQEGSDEAHGNQLGLGVRKSRRANIV